MKYINKIDWWWNEVLNYSGYYNKIDNDILYDNRDLFVNSCGHYKLIHLKKMYTVRTEGRHDYQLLYVAEGTAHFRAENIWHDVGKGGAFIYQPGVLQEYYYILPEKPDVYWIHFTGCKVKEYMETLRLLTERPMQLQIKEEYAELFEKIIQELRLDRYQSIEMAETYLHQLLITAARDYNAGNPVRQGYNSMFDEVMERFHRDYPTEISITDYADLYHISCSWFIREFKKYTGYSPKQYITHLRLQNAKELLNNRYLSINDIATMVGYENQLYFSRIFRKYTGISPSEYRERA